jgi:hypothetical protein
LDIRVFREVLLHGQQTHLCPPPLEHILGGQDSGGERGSERFVPPHARGEKDIPLLFYKPE